MSLEKSKCSQRSAMVWMCISCHETSIIPARVCIRAVFVLPNMEGHWPARNHSHKLTHAHTHTHPMHAKDQPKQNFWDSRFHFTVFPLRLLAADQTSLWVTFTSPEAARWCQMKLFLIIVNACVCVRVCVRLKVWFHRQAGLSNQCLLQPVSVFVRLMRTCADASVYEWGVGFWNVYKGLLTRKCHSDECKSDGSSVK